MRRGRLKVAEHPADAASYERCSACNGGPEHHDEQGCMFHWVYRGRDGVPFRLVMLQGEDR